MNEESPSKAPEPSSQDAKPTTAKVAQPVAEVALPVGPLALVLLGKGLGLSSESLVLANDASGKEVLYLDRTRAVAVSEVLRDDPALAFDLLLSASAVDWKTYRQTVYHLYSTTHHHYLVLKIDADSNERSPSLMPVWHAADWHEREAYDLMGIVYESHTDLRRILMPNYWLGHPLLKDYVEDDPRLVWNRR
jgi:NADH:ubiquinone oxidoreductase subunit C